MATVTQICPDCGCQFEQDQPWKKVCTDCYFARKERTGERRVKQLEEQVSYWQALAQGDKADEVGKLSRQCDRLTQELVEARSQIRVLEREIDWGRHQPPPRHTGSGIPEDMLKRLIQLVHPDKHDGKESAVKATQWLLGQRQ